MVGKKALPTLRKLIIELIQHLKTQFADQVYLEPGNGLVGNAGYLITTVLDRFDSDGKTVLVLDTSVNRSTKQVICSLL